jgi:hypothetical protein
MCTFVAQKRLKKQLSGKPRECESFTYTKVHRTWRMSYKICASNNEPSSLLPLKT